MRGIKRFYVRGCWLALLGIAASWPVSTHAKSTVLTQVKDNRCLACHQVGKKRVGPSFRAIAERYSKLESPEPGLVNSMMTGSRGRWGAVPMPAQTHLSPEDAQRIAAWILSLVNSDD